MAKILSAVFTILLAFLVTVSTQIASRPVKLPSVRAPIDGKSAVARAVDASAGLSENAAVVDDLTYARRLSLGLVGTLPSLEEIRAFERQPEADRRDWYLERLLADRRFSEYLAEHFSHAWLPDVAGDNFIFFRKQRFTYWLADQIHSGTPYDRIVREMISETGLWTDRPAVNFVTAYDADPEKLAGQTTKNFLGLRLDCAQCHDHPFAEWKQKDFRGVASHFGIVTRDIGGIQDSGRMIRYDVDDDSPGVLVPPTVPYGECRSRSDHPRRILADWVIAPTNERFARAVTNRVWNLLFGQPIVEPVDDLDGKVLLEGPMPILAEDFRENGHDLRRLIRVIAGTKLFAQPSALTDIDQSPAEHQFPSTRLLPAQMARSLVQISSLTTVDQNSNVVRRLASFFQRNEFVRFFQTDGDDDQGTVAQRLMLMNDRLVREHIKPELANASGRIAMLCPTDRQAIESVYLVCLTRRPTDEEIEYFEPWLAGTKEKARGRALEDLLWTLANSTEFSWNH